MEERIEKKLPLYIISDENGNQYYATFDGPTLSIGDQVKLVDEGLLAVVASYDFYLRSEIESAGIRLSKIEPAVNVVAPYVSKKKEAKVEEDDDIIEAEEVVEEEEEEFIEEEDDSEEGPDPNIRISLNVFPTLSLMSYEVDTAIRTQKQYKDNNDLLTGFDFISGVTITNDTPTIYRGVSLVFECSSPFVKFQEGAIFNLEPGSQLTIRPPFIVPDYANIAQLVEPLHCNIVVKLLSAKGRVLSTSPHNPFLLSPLGEVDNHFDGDKRLYCKLITPNDSAIKQLTVDASRRLKKPPFTAYLNEDRNDRSAEIQAIFEEIASRDIIYQIYPANHSGRFCQRVRLPAETLRDKKGCCLDVSILLCAALAEIGYHTVLILIEGHALCGVFLEEQTYFTPNGSCTNFGRFVNQMNLQEIIPIEAVELCNKNCSFAAAVEDARKRLNDYRVGNPDRFFIAHDVHTCHRGLFKPFSLLGDKDIIEAQKKTSITIDPVYIAKRIDTDVDFQEEIDRFSTWERKLLDANESNSLVNFRFSPASFVRLDKKGLIDTLKEGKPITASFIEVNCNQKKVSEQVEAILHAESEAYDRGDAVIFGRQKDFTKILNKNKTLTEETGAPTLYLCLGVMRYRSVDPRTKKDKGCAAPFLILPVKVEKRGMSSATYTITYDPGDATFNKAFVEYYKRVNDSVDFSRLLGIENISEYFDAINYFRINCHDDIALDIDTVFITNLSFSHFLMWKDIKDGKEELKKNPIVSSIVDGVSKMEPVSMAADPSHLEDSYHDFAAPLPYDSTQLNAILSAGEGKSFILDGPPGTGKSQTIVNIIANAIYNDKKVLFVAEKKAALDVVADRLAEIGLDRFCLELHSVKATKTAFFGKVQNIIESRQQISGSDYENSVLALEKKKAVVEETIRAMHEKQGLGLSLYEAITLHFNNLSAPLLELDTRLVEGIDEEEYQSSLTRLCDYQTRVNAYRGLAESNLLPIGLTKFEYGELGEAKKDFLDYQAALDETLASARRLISTNPDFVCPLNNATLKALARLCKATYGATFNIALAPRFLVLPKEDAIARLFDAVERLEKAKNALPESIDTTKLGDLKIADLILELDKVDDKVLSLAKSKLRRRGRDVLTSVSFPGSLPFAGDNILPTLKAIVAYRHAYQSYLDAIPNLAEYFDLDLGKEPEKREKARLEYEKLRDFGVAAKAFLSLFKEDPWVKEFVLSLLKEEIKEKESAFIIAYEKLVTIEPIFFNKYEIAESLFRLNADPLGALTTFLMEGCTDEGNKRIIDICAVNAYAEEITSPLIAPFIAAFRLHKISCEGIIPSFLHSYAEQVIHIHFRKRAINDFNASLFDSEIGAYRELIRRYQECLKDAITLKAEANIEHAKQSIDIKDLGVFNRLARNHGRGVSIRDALEQYAPLFHAYFPCFLMSPLSAAQYLSNDPEKRVQFDIVLFDEASQIPVHEAVGVISRGRSLIVAGDPKQMPPSTYFQGDVDKGIMASMMDTDSLLDECEAIQFPSVRLSYHYRSKHESLIYFSNESFYNGDLHTFPSPIYGKSAISFHLVDVDDTKTDSRFTPRETEAIVKTIKDVYDIEENKDKSLGIIVFNVSQVDALTKELEREFSGNASLRKKIADAAEASKQPYFIKSIENVQGDERDIIVFVISLRKSLAGHPVIFGPLAEEGGERRLNVAVTRARTRMIVVSTITDEDFAGDDYINNKGSLCLKHFIAHARNVDEGVFDAKPDVEAKVATIPHFIKRDLEKRGYSCALQVGNSKNRVDVAVRSKDGLGYVLGILVDDDEEITTSSLRDKEYVEPSVFASLSWHILKIYAVSYYKDREGVIDRIVMELKSIEADPIEEKIPDVPSSIISLGSPYARQAYVKTPMGLLAPINYRSDIGFSPSIRDDIQTIIDHEGPVHHDLIKERIREKVGFPIYSALASDYFEEALKRFASFQDEDGIYWPGLEHTRDLAFYRYGGRKGFQVPYEEFASFFRQSETIQRDQSETLLLSYAVATFELKEEDLPIIQKAYLRYKGK